MSFPKSLILCTLIIAAWGSGFSADIRLAKVKYRDEGLISDERPSRKPLRSGLDLLNQTYVDNREALEGKVYAIDPKKKLLIVQNIFTSGRQEFTLASDTVITGIDSFDKIQINDIVYVIYYYNIEGKLMPSLVYFVAGSTAGNPYNVSGPQKEQEVGKYINLLTVPEEHVRSHAALVLGNFNDRGAVAALINALRNDGSALVRLNSAKALGQIGDPWAVDDLIAALRDENKLVRWEVTKALSLIGDSAIRSLIARLYDPDAQMRMNVAETLGMIKSDRAIQPLVSLLRDEHPYVRCNAAWSLGEIGSSEAVQPLIESLKDTEPLVRTFAIDALQKLKNPEAIEPLIECLHDADQEVRSSAAVALLAITSVNNGEDYDKWSQWWQEYKYNY